MAVAKQENKALITRFVVQIPQQKIAYRKNSFFFLDRIYKTLSVVTVRKETNL